VAIHGTIEEAGLPDVLQLLSLGRKSGCLSVDDGTTHGEIYLEVGRVTYAAVANRIDRLGEILVKAGRITRQQLADAAQEQTRRSSKRQLGRILVDSGKIDRSDLEHYVRIQVEEAVYLLFTWKRGTFSFTTDHRPPNQPLLVSLDCESLLLEGARRVDEWSLIERKIPSFDLVYRRTKTRVTGDVAEELTDDQQRLLPLFDGARDVNGLIEATGMSEFDTGKALYGLIMAGFIQLVERRSQVRHLDFRELLAYVVREAEYADPERRRNAARHIVDCPACTERLRTIHVRRTTGTLLDAMGEPLPGIAEADKPPAEAPTAPVPAEPEPPSVTTTRGAATARSAVAPPPPPPRIERRAPSPVTAPIVPPPTADLVDLPPAVPSAAEVERGRREKDRRHTDRRGGTERRKGDRRAGDDRRHTDRRCGQDRRHLVVASWRETRPERRSGPRRAVDRRNGEGDRRLASAGMGMINRRSGGNGGVTTAPAPVTVTRSPTTVEVPNVPGVVEPPEVTPWAAGTEETVVSLDATADDAADTIEITPLAVETNEYPLLPTPSEKEAPEPPHTAPVTPPVASEPPGMRRTKDLVWLQSPEQAMDQIRASRAVLRAMGSSPPLTPSPAVPSPPPVPPAAPHPSYQAEATIGASEAEPAPAATPAGETQPRSIPVRAVQTGVDVPPPPPRRAPARAAESAPAVVRLEISRAMLRRAAFAAGIGGIVLLSYFAGRRGGNATPPEPTAVAEAPAERPSTPPHQQRAAPPTPVRTAAAPPRPAPATYTPPATTQRAATPMTVTTPAQAENPPSQQRPAQTAAPAPQVAAAQPPPQQNPPLAAVAAPASSAAATAAPEPSRPLPTAVEPDRELAAGGWTPVSRADAATALGGTLGIIQGLPVESVSQSTSGTRVRIRVTQLTDAGQRITLTETRAGAAVRSGPAILTALRVLPASEAFPYSTGTASLGNVLITARSGLNSEDLRGLLERLAEAR